MIGNCQGLEMAVWAKSAWVLTTTEYHYVSNERSQNIVLLKKKGYNFHSENCRFYNVIGNKFKVSGISCCEGSPVNKGEKID